MSLLTVRDLAVGYGAGAALAGVSLEVAAGEIVALVGPSGSGKSTLAAACLALLPPDARVTGTVAVAGSDLSRLGERALADVRGRTVGMVFQEPATALNPALTIGRQIGEVLRRHTALDRAAVRREVAALLARVGLEVAPDRTPHRLSGGQRQRVAIAMAIAAGPRLLVADEPTAALDPIARAGITALLVRLVREAGMGLLIVSHDLALVAGAADRIVVLDGGRVVEAGPADALLARPRSTTLARMVAALTLPPVPPAPPAPPIVEVAGATKGYAAAGTLFGRARHPALEDVSLALAPGETLAVIGRSGSGKSTLARAVLGLERPDTGTVRVDGQPWSRALRSRVQGVFQDPAASFDPLWTVGRIVAEPLGLAPHLAPAARAARVAAALEEVGLPADAVARPPHRFSGGQRQRIALARALVYRPAVLVLDEALSALDMAVRAELVALLVRLQAEHGLAYLFIAHDLALVRALAHRVLVLEGGRVVEEGTTAEVLDRPRHAVTQALVEAPAGPRGPAAGRGL